jgi:hypothetical protein
VPIEFGYVCQRCVDPTIIRQLSGRFFNPEEAAVPRLQTFNENIPALEQICVFKRGFANDDSRYAAPAGHWLAQVTFGENESSHLESRPQNPFKAACNQGLRTAVRPGTANIGRQLHVLA